MAKTIAKWVILIVLTVYAVWVVCWANSQAAAHTCLGMEVEFLRPSAADSVTRNGVLEELKKYPKKIVGAQLSQINTRDIEHYLLGFNNFEDVSCVLTSSRRLKVSIVPMIPEIRVFSGNESYYINKDGKRIPSNARFFVDVPVVEGDFNGELSPRDVLPLTRFISADKELSALTSMVRAVDPDNLLIVPRVSGHVINFGDTTRLAEKKKALMAFYRKVIPYKGWEEYDTVSVKFRSLVVATRRDKQIALHAPVEVEEVDPEEYTLPELPSEQSSSTEHN